MILHSSCPALRTVFPTVKSALVIDDLHTLMSCKDYCLDGWFHFSWTSVFGSTIKEGGLCCLNLWFIFLKTVSVQLKGCWFCFVCSWKDGAMYPQTKPNPVTCSYSIAIGMSFTQWEDAACGTILSRHFGLQFLVWFDASIPSHPAVCRRSIVHRCFYRSFWSFGHLVVAPQWASQRSWSSQNIPLMMSKPGRNAVDRL